MAKANRRSIRSSASRFENRTAGEVRKLNASSWKAFDFTSAIRTLCEAMCSEMRELSHIRMEEVAVGFSQTRKDVMHGIQASLTPLRFEHGERFTVRRGRTYTIQPVLSDEGREALYLLRFYLPRFLDLSFEEKMTTLVHELWHISPQFDGDLRRHPGRCYAHTGSQAHYDAAMKLKAEEYLRTGKNPHLHAFLRHNFAELRRVHGGIVGKKYRTPVLVPLGSPGRKGKS